MPEAEATCQHCEKTFEGEVYTPMERLRHITGHPLSVLLVAHHEATRPGGHLYRAWWIPKLAILQ